MRLYPFQASFESKTDGIFGTKKGEHKTEHEQKISWAGLLTGYIVPLIIASMKPFPSLFAQLRPFVTLGSLLIVSLFLSACGGGSTSSGADGGIIATGRALVTGNVASSTLPGDLNNITVTIQNRSTTTNAAGVFRLDDVPAGNQKIVFRKGGEASSLPITLQSQSKTTLNNVHINDQSVSTEKVEVDDHASSVTKEAPEESVKAEDQDKTPEQSSDDNDQESSNSEDDSESEMPTDDPSSEMDDKEKDATQDENEDDNDEEDDKKGEK